MSILIDEPLAEYVSPEEHEAHAEAALLVAQYHRKKAQAMRYRLDGEINYAQRREAECDALASQIESLDQ